MGLTVATRDHFDADQDGDIYEWMPYDLDGSGKVDIADFAIMAENWLKE